MIIFLVYVLIFLVYAQHLHFFWICTLFLACLCCGLFPRNMSQAGISKDTRETGLLHCSPQTHVDRHTARESERYRLERANQGHYGLHFAWPLEMSQQHRGQQEQCSLYFSFAIIQPEALRPLLSTLQEWPSGHRLLTRGYLQSIGEMTGPWPNLICIYVFGSWLFPVQLCPEYFKSVPSIAMDYKYTWFKSDHCNVSLKSPTAGRPKCCSTGQWLDRACSYVVLAWSFLLPYITRVLTSVSPAIVPSEDPLCLLSEFWQGLFTGSQGNEWYLLFCNFNCSNVWYQLNPAMVKRFPCSVKHLFHHYWCDGKMFGKSGSPLEKAKEANNPEAPEAATQILYMSILKMLREINCDCVFLLCFIYTFMPLIKLYMLYMFTGEFP